jgi:glycerol-3-phosphate dehydrogenase
MGEDTVDKAALIAGLDDRESKTKDLRIHGWLKHIDRNDPLHYYGTDVIPIRRLIEKDPQLGELLHPKLPYLKAQVVWAVRSEMARTVEDVLSRRTRAILLNARASIEMATEVARLMARELGHGELWQQEQVEAYQKLAKGYLLT